MSFTIDFAEEQEGPLLREIFLSVDMDLAGNIEDHVAIKKDGVLCGGGLLYQMDMNLFHLLTIAVRQDGRNRGIGGVLLRKILEQPWSCCRDAVTEGLQIYRVTTVARGSSRGFYLKHGLNDCRFEDLVEPFVSQCQVCSDVDQCHSAAMEYSGRRNIENMLLNQGGEHVM